MNANTVPIVTVSDGMKSNGKLSFFQNSEKIAFTIKRIYYIYGAEKNTKRGMHAHKELEQITFCPYGTIRFRLDDGLSKEEIILNEPNKGLYIGKGIWREMYWEEDNSVLVVAASMLYDENDYIRDYGTFLSMVKSGYWKKE